MSLLAEDVRISMPPLPAMWEGRRRAAEFVADVAFRLVPQARFVETLANRQPALAVYTRGPRHAEATMGCLSGRSCRGAGLLKGRRAGRSTMGCGRLAAEEVGTGIRARNGSLNTSP